VFQVASAAVGLVDTFRAEADDEWRSTLRAHRDQYKHIAPYHIQGAVLPGVEEDATDVVREFEHMLQADLARFVTERVTQKVCHSVVVIRRVLTCPLLLF
jgi:hypothetical protein